MDNSVIDYIYYKDHDMRKQIETDLEFKEYDLLTEKISEEIKAVLTEEQKELFEKLDDALSYKLNAVGRIYFKMGMKVGIRVVAESMYDS